MEAPGRVRLSNSLEIRFRNFIDLTGAEAAVLADLAAHSPLTIEPRRHLVRQGAAAQHVYLILDGWACRYRSLADGRRQILDFALPGDLCDLNVSVLDRFDHSVAAITELTVARIAWEDLHRVVTHHPNIAAALWRQELASQSIYREWIVNVGARGAEERLAHLFCEMFLRLESIGLTSGGSCYFPPTQSDLADATGLTAVHVNRTIQRLRRKNLIRLEHRVLTITDMDSLQGVGMFESDYLHFRRPLRGSDVFGRA